MNKLMEILRSKKKDKKGFTLMEMLIVVAIIAVLVAIAVPTFNSSLDKAKKAADDANIKTAYTEYLLNKADPEIVTSKPTFNDSTDTIGFADGTAYKLKYYDTINNFDSDNQWLGKKGSNEPGV